MPHLLELSLGVFQDFENIFCFGIRQCYSKCEVRLALLSLAETRCENFNVRWACCDIRCRCDEYVLFLWRYVWQLFLFDNRKPAPAPIQSPATKVRQQSLSEEAVTYSLNFQVSPWFDCTNACSSIGLQARMGSHVSGTSSSAASRSVQANGKKK